ncbi:Pantothenate kinase 4 [Seminavis robusta]|uniref:pantothenate kinase n=1 Tax=Seminavis robusta TaxID=568900 RepID=A0A9N8EW14_9STRA|nr:Pantothenate kinase 4 [Seminavis robusta]|eukprot:Sro2166_g317300.1 Pantothenate kinase 4 (794) ;mRNA; f:13787-16168
MSSGGSKRAADDGPWKTVALSFAAGAASMSLFVYARDRRRRRRRNDNDDDNEGSKMNFSQLPPKPSSNFIDTVCQSVEDAVEDIKSRIGEMPGRRTHWPWETIRKPKKASSKEPPDEPDPSMKLTYGITDRGKQESNPELCIGSIFGLDVGGTLAKLVYFEQRPDQDTMATDSTNFCGGGGSTRAKHYHMAASAQAVLMARRGHDDTSPPSLQTHESIGGHERMQPRNLSMGLLRRKLSSHSELNQQAYDDNTHDDTAAENPHDNTSAKKPIHTVASNDDIHNLYNLRPESVPDDLNAYATSVHYNEIHKRKSNSGKNSPKRNSKHTRSNSDGTNSTDASFVIAHDHTNHNNNNNTTTTPSMKKSRSMFDLSMSQKSRDHAEALDRFYHFARKLDTYREGVKDHKLSFYSRALGGEFHFIRFETRRMENAMELIRANDLHLTIREMGATGGGAHKYANDWDRILGIQMQKQEELESMVAGMQFVLSTVVGECYTFRPRKPKSERPSSERTTSSAGSSNNSMEEEEKKSLSPFSSDESDSESGEEPRDYVKTDMWNWSRKVQRDSISYSSTYPYLLVTIGTGVSILRVDGPRKHERISGSTIGGGTYWGLIRLLTNIEEFEDCMQLAEHGDPTKVDMMVGDIYGNNPEALEKLGLPAGLVASSFGKLVAKEDPAAGLTQEDLARALLLMVTNNIGQVAYLNAQLNKTSRIYFVGNFLRGNKLSQRRLSFAINYWSKGEMEALFLEHEGYFGALGAFLLSQGINPDDLGPPRRQSTVSQSHSFHHRRSQTLEDPI